MYERSSVSIEKRTRQVYRGPSSGRKMIAAMDTTSVTAVYSSSSVAPCSPNEVALSPGDCVEGGVEEWLEDETLAGFRVWQLAGIILSILLTITIALCCCIRFRVPRTKQEIEADYIRKRITKSFRKELAKINNSEMGEMDLRRALDRVRAEFNAETELRVQRKEEMVYGKQRRGFRARFNDMFYGMRVRFTKGEPMNLNGII